MGIKLCNYNFHRYYSVQKSYRKIKYLYTVVKNEKKIPSDIKMIVSYKNVINK